MKVKVSVPATPVCTVKLEIEEAQALLAALANKNDLASPEMAKAVCEMLREMLAKELGISLEPTLFDAAYDEDVKPKQIEGE